LLKQVDQTEFVRQHSDVHHHRSQHSQKRLAIVLGLTAVYMIVEVVGGWLSGSLALIADAGHMLADVAALSLALFATWFSSRPATPNKTFGYYRLEILAALINGVVLILIALLVSYEAYERWYVPPKIESDLMIGIAIGGLLINMTCAAVLHKDHKHNLNMHGAWLHIISDALGSIGAITAGLIIYFYGWTLADPLVSLLINGLIIWSSWQLVRESTNVLLEGTPAHINLVAVEEAILETSGVEAVHDLHVWTITSGREALSAHVVHMDSIKPPELLKILREKLHDRFGVDHLTIQMETATLEDEQFSTMCQGGAACFQSKVKDTSSHTKA
jgi:cobalt-zinc-cadmium efflux system protein